MVDQGLFEELMQGIVGQDLLDPSAELLRELQKKGMIIVIGNAWDQGSALAPVAEVSFLAPMAQFAEMQEDMAREVVARKSSTRTVAEVVENDRKGFKFITDIYAVQGIIREFQVEMKASAAARIDGVIKVHSRFPTEDGHGDTASIIGARRR